MWRGSSMVYLAPPPEGLAAVPTEALLAEAERRLAPAVRLATKRAPSTDYP
jgi:hypothetical protein